MSLLSLIFGNRNVSASVAKERLQLIIAHERVNEKGPDFLPSLQKELIAVISKYVDINPDDIKVGLERHGFDPEALKLIKDAYRILYRSKLNLQQAVELMQLELPVGPELDRLLEFLQTSSRGVIR